MAGTTSERDALAALRAGAVAPVYLLLGDDEVGKGPMVGSLEALVEPDLRPFNLERFYANEVSLAKVVSAARTLPMLGRRRVILLLRSEAVLKPKGRASQAADDAEDPRDQGTVSLADDGAAAAAAEFEAYLAAPSPDACLVLIAGDANRAGRLAKLLLRQAVVVEFWGLKTDREARGRDAAAAREAAHRLVRQRAAEAGLRLEADAVEPLIDHAGTDIAALRGDLERLFAFCAGRGAITEEDVRAVVGGAALVDSWDLTRRIERGETAQALAQLRLALDGGASPYMILGQLGYFVRATLPRAAAARVPAAVDAVFRTDLALKTSGGDPQVLLERLVVELCGAAGAGTARPLRRG